MLLKRLTMTAYGRCTNVSIDLGDGVTVVLGANEAGKSTALDALSDLLWGIPTRTNRASDFPRGQLRVDADLEVDGASHTVVRRSTGLFAEDLVTEIVPPWDPAGRGSSPWWRTRLGIDHDSLRRGGRELFEGTGDIAEIVFSAREGRSVRELHAEIDKAADSLYRSHRGARNVQLRLSEGQYQVALADRDARLTRATDVVEQREAVVAVQNRLSLALDEVKAVAERLKTAEENSRVIKSVLNLNRARAELELISREGGRLSPSQYAEYARASVDLRDSAKLADELGADITRITRLIDALAVDDLLLNDKATLNRLQPNAAARIADLRRADEEFGPAAAKSIAGLLDLLRSIGIEASDDLDGALAGARVRADHAAILNSLADRLEALEEKRQAAKSKRNEALDALLTRGISVDFKASKAPSEEALDGIRGALVDARGQLATARQLLAEARESANHIRDGAPEPHSAASLSHVDVLESRRRRDVAWGNVRRSWVSGELPNPADRVDIATGVDAALSESDLTADDEAVERARVAAQDARIEAHVVGLDAARQREAQAEATLAAASESAASIEGAWDDAWGRLGVAATPSVESAAVVVSLLITAHAEHARDRSAAGQIAELGSAWADAADLVGLPRLSATAAWRTQAQVLQEVESVQADLAEAQSRESQARNAWDGFMADAVELLRRHGAVDDAQPGSPANVEQGLAELVGRLGEAAKAAARRTAYSEQIDEKQIALETAQRDMERARETLQRLAEAHSLDLGDAFDLLAERAERAADPLARESEALRDIDLGLDPGSDSSDVVNRLDGQGQVAVDQACHEARATHQEACDAADGVREEQTLARKRLAELEAAAGAADAEAALASSQAEVVRLTEEWAVLALQRQMLSDVLEKLGSDDTRPLLTHAGQILDRLTGGRWVALRAEEEGASRKMFVVRADADRFSTSELSEGTADQVYLSLRLAAVAELHSESVASGQHALPLVLDDVLMSFDDVRASDALEVLHDLAPGLQVIVFTHHMHVADAAEATPGVTVARLPEPTPISGAIDGDQVRAHAQDGAVSGDSSPRPALADGRQVDPAEVRRWAESQGINVSARGRVQQALIDQYRAAHSQ